LNDWQLDSQTFAKNGFHPPAPVESRQRSRKKAIVSMLPAARDARCAI
jgi:hypothetical protein